MYINHLWAAFTELLRDKAYYWMYSQQVAWGYFAHPPVVVLLIAVTVAWGDGELGVRLGSVLMTTAAALWLL